MKLIAKYMQSSRDLFLSQKLGKKKKKIERNELIEDLDRAYKDPFHGTEPWEDPQDFDEFGNVK